LISLNVFRYALLACLLAAAAYSFLLARAAWLFGQDTAASVPAAVRLAPYNSAYLGRLAAWRAGDRVALLHRAVEVNPFDFQSWIQLGFSSEFQQHDLRLAETYYLRAAAVNHMYLPRWTLTNYYFRHGDEAEFFRWANASLEITPFSPEPIFEQMWMATQDAAKISAAIPDRPRVLLPYAWHLSNNEQNTLIPVIVKRLVSAVGKRDPRAWGRDDLVAAIEDRLVAADARLPALDVWVTLVRGRWLSADIPSASRPITNGEFRSSSYRHGFDWRLLDAAGARVDQLTAEGAVRLYVSGDQPERCVLLEQAMPAEAGHMYRLQWTASSSEVVSPSGLAWHVRPFRGARQDDDVQSSDLLAGKNGSWDFRAPANSQLCRLSLEYARPLGSLHARGTVMLRQVSAVMQ
jgi:hypothetical protein